MEQDVDNDNKTVCCACLSRDRNLYSIKNFQQVYQMFHVIIKDYAGDRPEETIPDVEQQICCWECLAVLKRLVRFKWQVHNAQKHLKVVKTDHTYTSQCLSSLRKTTKIEYDNIYIDYNTSDGPEEYTAAKVKTECYNAPAVGADIKSDDDDPKMEAPETAALESAVASESQLDPLVSDNCVQQSDSELETKPITTPEKKTLVKKVPQKKSSVKQDKVECGYTTEYLTQSDMITAREEDKQKPTYVSSDYKCELCIIRFDTDEQVKDHFISAHKAKSGQSACKICYVYVDDSELTSHTNGHYMRHTCSTCGHKEHSARLMQLHVESHTRLKDCVTWSVSKGRVKKKAETKKPPSKPGGKKKRSKTIIEGYQCLECDMFFKTYGARKNHIARAHREGFQCHHCKKRFVNKSNLAIHIRLHDGPLPREECPICHNMVRTINIKYHIQRHQTKARYECVECKKVFSHITTYQGHLKYSRAHATDQVLKFPCPMCDKRYPNNETMRDHFNYQHLGKTSHKCPICDKPIATKANVDKHIMRVHGEKKDKPRNHVCFTCGKSFTNKKLLSQHELIHTGERPVVCELCDQTFKQKATLYTHRKRVHKLTSAKKVVEFMETKEAQDKLV